MLPREESSLILVIDDTPTNLDLLSETLSDAGFEVAVATSGESALKQVDYDLPSLILLDVMMPGIDGFETCRRLKANPRTWDIPIIFMTALADPIDKVNGLNLGAVDYITKPFQAEEVLARVQTQLQLYNLTKMLERQNQQLQNCNQNLETQVAARTAELSQSLQQLKQTQLQLIQNEKMSALGSLVAGIAHEINNPINFIAGNLQPARSYVQDLFAIIDFYQQGCAHLTPEMATRIERLELNYIREDFPKLLDSICLGIERIRNISTSLRTFTRTDTEQKQLFNLHEGLEGALLMLKHRLKATNSGATIDVTTNYGEIPAIECYPGQLNQVFMNLLANAIDAIEEACPLQSPAARPETLGQITITTALDAEKKHVSLTIADNGIGMSETVQHQIFDHLFTTKAAGKGTGLGMAIVWQIVVDNHQGAIEVTSAPGQGSQFLITLPVISAKPVA